MPYQITLTDLQVENIVIYRQADEDGNMEIKMALNSTLTSAGGDSEGKNKIFELTAQQQTAIVNFIKPSVQEAATEYDVTPPTWAQ